MKLRLASLFTGLLMVLAAMFGTVGSPGSAEAAQVKRLIFASAGFHESNRYWTIARSRSGRRWLESIPRPVRTSPSWRRVGR